MGSYLWPAGATAIWLALFYKLWSLRRDPGNPTLRLLCTAIAGLALGLTSAVPVFYVAFDTLVGVPNLARLLMHAAAMIFCIAVQRLLLGWVYPPDQARRRARRWLWVYGPALVVQVALFAGAPIGVEAVDFTVRYGNEPSIMAFRAILGIVLVVTVADIVRLCLRFAGVAGRPFLRIGLRFTGIGAGIGLLYWVADLVHELVRLAAWPVDVVVIPDAFGQNLFAVTSFVGSVLVAVGLTIPAWGPRLAAGVSWLRRYRSYRQLYPLWTLLYEAMPEIALAAPSTRNGRWWAGDLDYRLVRRVVEIRDGRLALRPYLDATVAERAGVAGRRAGLRGEALQAAVEAVAITHAVRARRLGRPAAVPPVDDVTGGTDLAAEAAWLGRVARALPGGPAVPESTVDQPGPGESTRDDPRAGGS